MLLGNNVLLVVACGAVLLGTLYPLALDALGLGKISVGPPYFDTVFVPLMAPLVFLMGVGPLARWKDGRAARPGARGCAGPPASRSSRALLAGWLPGASGAWPTLGLLMACWIVALGRHRPVRAAAPARHPAPSLLARACAAAARDVGMMAGALSAWRCSSSA